VLGKDKDPKTERAIRDVEITPGMMKAIKEQKRLSILPVNMCSLQRPGSLWM
jgi:hypothetical protein